VSDASPGVSTPPPSLRLPDGRPVRTIAVLAGGPSCEREVSLVSGRAVAEALASKGFSVFTLDPPDDLAAALAARGADLVFIALHGTFGEDGTVQRLLDAAGIPYTGPGAEASERTFDKAVTQKLLRAAGIPVPEFTIARRGGPVPDLAAPPFVVKPACSGSSVGITIVRDPREIPEALRLAFEHSDEVLIERYVEGRELTVGVLGGRALPVVEIIPGRKFYDYQAKYGDAGTRYEAPARLDEALAARVRDVALSTCRALGCGLLARVDLILDPGGSPYVLEANTVPGLTGRSLLPKAAAAAGIDFPGLCVKIMELSLQASKRGSSHGQAD